MPKYFLLPLGLLFLVSTTLSSFRNSLRQLLRAAGALVLSGKES
jgi:hypothetical protein